MSHEKFILGFTMGDPNGIGPEVLLKALSDSRMMSLFTPVIFGSNKVINYWRSLLKLEKFNTHAINEVSQISPKRVNVLECASFFDRVEPGIPVAKAGRAAFDCLSKAVQALVQKKIHALVTLPIDKATIQSDNFKFPGHTEYLAAQFNQEQNLMLMCHNNLRVAVVTGHIPLKNVASTLTPLLVYTKARILNDSLKLDFNIQKPKIALLGLNPHAGDNGLLGTEEKEIHERVLLKTKSENILMMGPYPADGFFAMGLYRKFDGILAMYHDQGLIPFKTISEGFGVNYTAGLPAVRTSPDHGVAYDIAGKNRANEASVRNAIYAALDIAKTRAENLELYENSLKAVSGIKELVSGEDSVIKEEN